MDDAPLLERRRASTRRDLHRTALDLFERQGVRETTVQQIADAAGVSARTFFRYFPTKEAAGLPGQHRLREAVERLDVPADADLVGLVVAVRAATATAISREEHDDLDAHRRIDALLAAEPELLAVAARQDQEIAVRLRERLIETAPAADAAGIALLAEVALAVWRSTWVRWEAAVAAGEPSEPATLLARTWDDLATLLPSPPPPVE